MKPDVNEFDDFVKRHLPSAPGDEMEAAAARVLQRLRLVAERPIEPVEDEGVADPQPGSGTRWRWVAAVSALAAVLAIAIAATIQRRPAGESSVGTALDGAAYLASGRPIRTNDAPSGMVLLPDGSRVEMQSGSELSLERAEDGLGIRLNTGSIIVNAAKQRQGHLYVQTRDMTVSVVGTIFLVNAEQAGSRVAVIEGEVRVREPEKQTETRLRPGEQISTSVTLAPHPVKDEIAWSRNADAHLAILESFMKGMAATAAPLTRGSDSSQTPNAGDAGHQEFEEASVRPCDPDNVPAPPAGARGGGANSFQLTPGRTHALCVTLATLIRTAYGYGPMQLEFMNRGNGPGRPGFTFNNVYGLGVEDGLRIRGGPDWIRSEHYTIDAIANDAATAEDMRGAMLRALLEKRFQLKAHVEIEQAPAFNLTIATSGLKIKPVESGSPEDAARGIDATVSRSGACEPQPPLSVVRGQPVVIRPAQPGERQPPPPSAPGQLVTILYRNFVDVRRGEKPTCGVSVQRNGPNSVLVAGGVQLRAMANSLASVLGGVVVTDKTRSTDKFNVLLEYARDENAPGRRPEDPAEPSDVPLGRTIFRALEEQLGLKLEPATTPREYLVIDHVERPKPN
jgi:uncharacterized protein (TIGR03435 family)